MDSHTTLQLATDAQRNVERLTALGHDVPKALTAALELRDAADLAPDPGSIDEALAGATPKNIAEKVERWVEQRTRYEALQRYKADVLNTVNRRVLIAHQQAAAEIFDVCRDGFAEAASTFVEAFHKLPATWRDADTLVRSGPAVVAEFGTAAAAVTTLDTYRDIRRATPGGNNVIGQIPGGLEFTACSDSLVAVEVCRVRGGGPLGKWGEWMDLDGVEGLVWRSPSELAAAVKALPVAEMRPVRSGIGVRLEKQLVRG